MSAGDVLFLSTLRVAGPLLRHSVPFYCLQFTCCCWAVSWKHGVDRVHCHADDIQIYILPQTNIHCDVSIRLSLMDNNFSKTTVFFESAN